MPIDIRDKGKLLEKFEDKLNQYNYEISNSSLYPADKIRVSTVVRLLQSTLLELETEETEY